VSSCRYGRLLYGRQRWRSNDAYRLCHCGAVHFVSMRRSRTHHVRLLLCVKRNAGWQSPEKDDRCSEVRTCDALQWYTRRAKHYFLLSSASMSFIANASFLHFRHQRLCLEHSISRRYRVAQPRAPYDDRDLPAGRNGGTAAPHNRFLDIMPAMPRRVAIFGMKRSASITVGCAPKSPEATYRTRCAFSQISLEAGHGKA